MARHVQRGILGHRGDEFHHPGAQTLDRVVDVVFVVVPGVVVGELELVLAFTVGLEHVVLSDIAIVFRAVERGAFQLAGKPRYAP